MPSLAPVVRILKSSEGFVSGEEIAGNLKVSRASVWKRIKKLRTMGFDINASTNKGYRLISLPDTPSSEVLSSVLSTSFIGKKIEYHSSITSTNERAMLLGREGTPSGTVITADRQSAGRARGGGIWASPPGKNLYLSVLIRPPVPLWRASEIADLAANSLKMSVENFTSGHSFRISDYGLWAGQKKLGGVLCEVSGEIGKIYYMAVGIGLNVSHFKADTGSDSLFSLTGKMLSRAELTADLLENIEAQYLKWNAND